MSLIVFSVMMHPQEFSIWGADNKYENVVNETMIQELRYLLRTVKESGMSVTVISSIKDYFGRTNDPCATPAPATPTSTSSTEQQSSITESYIGTLTTNLFQH
jgi:hypothetical protein